MAKRKGRRPGMAAKGRPPVGRPSAGNRYLLLLSIGLMLTGLAVALVAGLGGALAGPSAAPEQALAGWPGVLAGGGLLLLGFAVSNAAQGHSMVAAGWALVAGGAGASLMLPSVPTLSLALAAAGVLLVGYQFARRLRRNAPRGKSLSR